MNDAADDLAGTVRPVTGADLPALKQVIDTTGLFPSDMLDEMISGYLSHQNNEIWLAYHDGVDPVGLLYCAPERMTSGSWNNLLLAVRTDRHGKGVGTALMRSVERALAERGARIVLVEHRAWLNSSARAVSIAS